MAISCGQINYRTYVTARDPGRQGYPNQDPDGGADLGGTARDRLGVWFFGTSLDHALVAVPRLLWRMPWTRSRISIAANWSATPATAPARPTPPVPGTVSAPRAPATSSPPGTWRMSATDSGGTSFCELVDAGLPADQLDGFTDRDHWLRVLTHPTAGWYPRLGGGVGCYSIWHPAMAPRRFESRAARFLVFEQLGLIGPDAVPHSVLGQPGPRFDIHTPPRRFRPG